MKKLGIVALIVFLLSFALLLASSDKIKKQSLPKQVITTQQQATVQEPLAQISYTDSGFQPLTVKLGIKTVGRVVFLNLSSKNVDIESNDHPTHNKYPILNVGVIAPNDLQSRKVAEFTKAGTYTFHNHLNPAEVGTIEVIKQE